MRIYLPPDANCLLSCYDHCQASKNYINVIVASKHPSFQWLSAKEAKEHCTKGIGVWKWASRDEKEPDIVIASAGDTPTLEALAAVTILKDSFPTLKIRFVNVVDVMKLEPHALHPHGLTDNEFNKIFTKDKPVLFAFHGYPKFIYDMLAERKAYNFEVHGYNEEGSITTAFDMRVQNKIDRFNLSLSALRLLGIDDKKFENKMKNLLKKHKRYIAENGEDIEEVTSWQWH